MHDWNLLIVDWFGNLEEMSDEFSREPVLVMFSWLRLVGLLTTLNSCFHLLLVSLSLQTPPFCSLLKQTLAPMKSLRKLTSWSLFFYIYIFAWGNKCQLLVRCNKNKWGIIMPLQYRGSCRTYSQRFTRKKNLVRRCPFLCWFTSLGWALKFV